MKKKAFGMEKIQFATDGGEKEKEIDRFIGY